MIWRCLVVDDEPQAREILKTYISQTPSLELVSEQPHALGAFSFLQDHTVDLLFLDIEMPKLTGIDFVKSLTVQPKIIFTTAHKDYAWEGFELGAVDFLLKPISFERFLKSVQRMTQQTIQIQNNQNPENIVYFRAERKMVRVTVSDILFVESLKDYVRVVLPDRQIVTKQTITTVEEMLPATDFIRVHRSFVVQRKKIDSFSSHALFIGKHEIPVGPLYRLDVTRKLANVNA